uniref:Uncharacterized protein n=1 Tax=Amphimedon queenslandica TaxID=400682 RepID=A0A1X7TJ23_AMPQE
MMTKIRKFKISIIKPSTPAALFLESFDFDIKKEVTPFVHPNAITMNKIKNSAKL